MSHAILTHTHFPLRSIRTCDCILGCLFIYFRFLTTSGAFAYSFLCFWTSLFFFFFFLLSTILLFFIFLSIYFSLFSARIFLRHYNVPFYFSCLLIYYFFTPRSLRGLFALWFTPFPRGCYLCSFLVHLLFLL